MHMRVVADRERAGVMKSSYLVKSVLSRTAMRMRALGHTVFKR